MFLVNSASVDIRVSLLQHLMADLLGTPPTDLATSYKYLLDLVHYSKGDVKTQAHELSEQIKMRMEMGVTEISDELITKAEIIVHKVSLGFRKRE